MNYIEQIRGFWRSHELEAFSTHAIALYLYLLEVNNTASWIPSFKRNNSKICADLGISQSVLNNARNRLKQAGMLDFKTVNGSPNVIYSFQISLLNNKETTDSQTTYLYVIKESSTNKCKIGVSGNIERRTKELENSLGLSLSIIIKQPIVEAFKAETKLHIYFKEKNIYGEWFNLSPKDIDIIRNYSIKNSKKIGFVDEVTNEVTNEVSVEVTDEVLTTKDKLNKTKQEELKKEKEQISISDFGSCFKKVEDLKNELINSQWIQAITTQKKIPIQELQHKFENFCNELILKGIDMRTKSELQNHFINWLNKQRLSVKEKPISKLEQNMQAGEKADEIAKKLLGI